MRTRSSTAILYLARALVLAAFAALAGCASMGPSLPSATPEELVSQELQLGVRTVNPNGRFEVLSPAGSRHGSVMGR